MDKLAACVVPKHHCVPAPFYDKWAAHVKLPRAEFWGGQQTLMSAEQLYTQLAIISPIDFKRAS